MIYGIERIGMIIFCPNVEFIPTNQGPFLTFFLIKV